MDVNNNIGNLFAVICPLLPATNQAVIPPENLQVDSNLPSMLVMTLLMGPASCGVSRDVM